MIVYKYRNGRPATQHQTKNQATNPKFQAKKHYPNYVYISFQVSHMCR